MSGVPSARAFCAVPPCRHEPPFRDGRNWGRGLQGPQRASFTLVELVMVIGIIAIAVSMLESMTGRRVIRGSLVKASADQLASVLRKARQMAMDHHGFYGVSFNIQNAAGSSGSVLNNRSGGHWYRIIGPHDPDIQGGWSSGGGYDLPFFFSRNCSGAAYGDTELGWWLNTIQNDFVGPRYVLPKGQARFLALTDEDNGNYWVPQSKFGPTYPRPWFGAFLQETWDGKPRLYAWGGYEAGNSNFLDNFDPHAYYRPERPSVNYSGFYYQGDDPTITGCVNPRNRYIIDAPGGTLPVNDPQGATAVAGQEDFQLFAQGQVRPLINGDWLDCVILFNPDGTASMDDFMAMRHQYGQTGRYPTSYYYWNGLPASAGGNDNLAQLGPGDMCNYVDSWISYNAADPYNNRFEASNYTDVTGMYYITLGADAPDDTVAFSSAQQALGSMMPIYRVGVSRLGAVKVIKVQTAQPAGVTLDPTWQQGIWNATYNIGYQGYWNNLALSKGGVQLMPAEDFVTADMMVNQQWWIDP
jgi:hypothetical protein